MQVAALAAVCGTFVVRSLSRDKPLIDLRLFADRNFALANVVIAGFAVSMFGSIAILPLFVQGLLGYPVLDAGLLFFPHGLAAGFSMVVVGAVLSGRDGLSGPARPDAGNALGAAVLAKEIARQAQMLAYSGIFGILGWTSAALLPPMLLMQKPQLGSTVAVH